MKQLLLLALAAGLSACAVTEDTVPVPYTASAVSADPRLAMVRVSVSATDARTTNRGRIGSKMNGYGMEMAAIRTSDDIAAAVKSAITTELKDRGYSLTDGGARSTRG